MCFPLSSISHFQTYQVVYGHHVRSFIVGFHRLGLGLQGNSLLEWVEKSCIAIIFYKYFSFFKVPSNQDILCLRTSMQVSVVFICNISLIENTHSRIQSAILVGSIVFKHICSHDQFKYCVMT